LQVHDELVFDVPRGELAEAKQLIGDAMRKAWNFGVPLEVEIGYGDNWLEAH